MKLQGKLSAQPRCGAGDLPGAVTAGWEVMIFAKIIILVFLSACDLSLRKIVRDGFDCVVSGFGSWEEGALFWEADWANGEHAL